MKSRLQSHTPHACTQHQVNAGTRAEAIRTWEVMAACTTLCRDHQSSELFTDSSPALCPRALPPSPPSSAPLYLSPPLPFSSPLHPPHYQLTLATAEAYTVMTRKKVIIVSQPNTSDQVVPLEGPKQPGDESPPPMCSWGMRAA